MSSDVGVVFDAINLLVADEAFEGAVAEEDGAPLESDSLLLLLVLLAVVGVDVREERVFAAEVLLRGAERTDELALFHVQIVAVLLELGQRVGFEIAFPALKGVIFFYISFLFFFPMLFLFHSLVSFIPGREERGLSHSGPTMDKAAPEIPDLRH